jgi:hypothetical protein
MQRLAEAAAGLHNGQTTAKQRPNNMAKQRLADATASEAAAGRRNGQRNGQKLIPSAAVRIVDKSLQARRNHNNT